jgi:hypothetical protein
MTHAATVAVVFVSVVAAAGSWLRGSPVFFDVDVAGILAVAALEPFFSSMAVTILIISGLPQRKTSAWPGSSFTPASLSSAPCSRMA